MKFRVLFSLVPNVEEKLRKFQKKFAKFGEGAFMCTKSEPYYAEVRDYDTLQLVTRRFVDFEVEGHYQISGYEFVAKLDYIDETGTNLISAVPGTADIPEIYRTRTTCDHCKSERARKHTILLQNTETKEFVQVGRQCVTAYLGCDVNSFMSYYTSFETLGDYLNSLEKVGHNRKDMGFQVQDILEQTVAEVNAHGYISQAVIDRWFQDNADIIDAGYEIDCPLRKTSSKVFGIVNENTDKDGKIIFPRYEVTEEIKQQVEVIKQFITEIANPSDYEFNLQNLIQLTSVGAENLGLVVSLVGYYGRETRKREEANKPETEKSAFVGQVGEKIEFSAKAECVFSTESQFGMCYIYKFMVGKDIIIWKTNKRLDTNTELQVKGTIKAHNLFGNNRQTEVTRCRVA